MRLTVIGFAAVLLGSLAFARGGDGVASKEPLVVHEWGTFTSMQGSDGIGLEGLQREEERLPEFVYSRTKVRDCPLRKYGYKGLEVPATHVTQKMETPVLYFHTKTERHVRVRVDFSGGLITQWYPVSNLIGPPENDRSGSPLDLSTVKGSFLEWDVDLLPRSGVAPQIPAVSSTDPWRFAREVDAAWVRTEPRKAPERLGPTESEQFLFYRGLGTFHLPIETHTSPGGMVEVRNGGKPSLPALFAMQVDGTTGRFLELGALASGDSATARLSTATPRDLTPFAADLRAAVSRALVAQGLFADEAAAMVNTWSRSWFTAEGTRLLYVVPREVTDSLLPLHITPAPDSLVRVLVGRLECVTPEVEAEVEAALRDRASSDAAVSEDAMRRLARFDRFLEPTVRSVLSHTTDDVVRRSGEALIASLK